MDLTGSVPLLCVQFNQDFSSLAVGSGHGLSLESLSSSADKLERIHSVSIPEGVRILERLFSSSFVAFVTSQNPRKLRIYHFNKEKEIWNFSYVNTIVAVRLNRVRLVVCLEELLYIYDIRDMKILHTIQDTPLNANGIIALSTNANNSYLAYPYSETIGRVQVFDTLALQVKLVIYAHESPVTALGFNAVGTMLATASIVGTVIRVFSIEDGTKLFEFRRGIKSALIYSLAFSPDDKFLAVSSNTETVHVFRLQQEKPPFVYSNVLAFIEYREVKEETWLGWMKGMLPGQVTNIWDKDRAFATIQTPFHGIRSVVAMTKIQGKNTNDTQVQVQIASYDGFLYIYSLNMKAGGNCLLLAKHRLMEDLGTKE